MSYMDHAKGREALLEMAGILDTLRIPFFLMQGTALGAYRDKGFTPTEKDIDLGILIEDLRPKSELLMTTLIDYGYDIEALVKPSNFVRTVVAWKDCIHFDLVGFFRFNEQRYAVGPIRPWTVDDFYAIVHKAEMLETYEDLELFGRTFKVPSPVEAYLELEYGRGWRTPKEDHISRTRVYNFLQENGIV